MYTTKNKILNHVAKTLCKRLRNYQTNAEKIFWNHVRGRKFCGLKFRRQFPVFYEIDNQEWFYIVDFFCYEKKIVIEIDGAIHDLKRSEDAKRSKILKSLGLRILRVKNEEIEQNVQMVLEEISEPPLE